VPPNETQSTRSASATFVSLTHLHFDAYSCRVAAFPTSAASICTVTPKTVIFSDDRQAVDCPLELVRDPVRGGRTRLPLA
jgi:hypothetical protein